MNYQCNRYATLDWLEISLIEFKKKLSIQCDIEMMDKTFEGGEKHVEMKVQ